MSSTPSILLLLFLSCLSFSSGKQILMVQTLTRHGTRAPDKIVGKQICRTIVDPESGSVHRAFVEVFGTGPAELTNVGVRQMRDVGSFLRERYHGFLWSDYPAHSRDWEFIAREGTRQQRSMAGIVQGIFPDDAVPISVTRRESDAILGGPAPQCGALTHDYIIEWHRTKGREMVKERASVIKPLERVCNVSLIDDPVNNVPGGPNPHAFIGDISDMMDSLYEANREPLPISWDEHRALTQLAFDLEQGAHFDFPGGAAMHAGGFPHHLLSAFEEIVANGGKRPSNLPKMRMHTCSRELHYGLSHLFGWTNNIRIPNQPVGRIRAGTTFIWELHSDLKIRSYYYQYPDNFPHELQPPMTVEEYRANYEKAIAACGDWKTLCVENKNRCVQQKLWSKMISTKNILATEMMLDDYADEDENLTMNSPQKSSTAAPSNEKDVVASTGSTAGWIAFALLLSIALALAFRRQQQRSDYSPV